MPEPYGLIRSGCARLRDAGTVFVSALPAIEPFYTTPRTNEPIVFRLPASPVGSDRPPYRLAARRRLRR